jgi:hypothetical protein
MTLLKLPDAARAALATGKLTVADALELHKLTGNGGADAITDTVIGKAVTGIAEGYNAATVIRQAQAELRRARAEQATREQLDRDGIMVVTEQRRQRQGWPRVYGGDTARHAKGGCLAAYIASWSGEPEYVCINPASHPRSRENREARADAERRETERESRKAAKARDVACQQIAAGPLPTARDLTCLLAATVLTGSGGGYSEALRLAWRWLRDSGAVNLDQDQDHYAARTAVTAAGGDRAALLRYARAYCLALDELHVRSRGYGMPTWSERHTAHLARLTEQTGYEPTPVGGPPARPLAGLPGRRRHPGLPRVRLHPARRRRRRLRHPLGYRTRQARARVRLVLRPAPRRAGPGQPPQHRRRVRRERRRRR